MSYGFGKKVEVVPPREDVVDIRSLASPPVVVDPAREELALRIGAELGFADRGQSAPAPSAQTLPAAQAPPASGQRVTRAKAKVPQGTLYIKGPQDVIDWFVELTNSRGHNAYWQTLAEIRAAMEKEAAAG